MNILFEWRGLGPSVVAIITIEIILASVAILSILCKKFGLLIFCFLVLCCVTSYAINAWNNREYVIVREDSLSSLCRDGPLGLSQNGPVVIRSKDIESIKEWRNPKTGERNLSVFLKLSKNGINIPMVGWDSQKEYSKALQQFCEFNKIELRCELPN